MSVRLCRAARLSVFLLLLGLLSGLLQAGAVTPDDPEELLRQGGYFDVPQDAWYAEAAAWAKTSGVLEGTAKSTFSPDEPLSRADFLAALYRLAGSPAVVEGSRFSDVSLTQRTSAAILWAEQEGLITGVAPALLAPDAAITREQAALILFRLSGLPDSGSDRAAGSERSFPDLQDVSPWAAEAMEWAINTGLLEGTETGVIPGACLTRAQAAVLLQRYAQRGDR